MGKLNPAENKMKIIETDINDLTMQQKFFERRKGRQNERNDLYKHRNCKHWMEKSLYLNRRNCHCDCTYYMGSLLYKKDVRFQTIRIISTLDKLHIEFRHI